jgi:peroxiredoxin
MAELNVGDRAPDFRLKSTSGEEVSLADFAGKKNVLVAFYTKDTVVLPVSVDSIPTHNEFRSKHAMTHHLLSDFKREASRAFGVLDEDRYFAKRAYFLVDKDGIVRWKHVEDELAHSRTNRELLDVIGTMSS